MSSIDNKRLAPDLDADERAEVGRQLKRIQDSRRFAHSDKAKKLLSYIVEQALAGREDDLNEYSIALSVYGKGQDFDPSADRFVSTAAGALRKKLDEYYSDEGREDGCVITIPTGGFVPELRLGSEPEPTAIQPTLTVPEEAKAAARLRSRLMMLLLAAVAAVALLGLQFLYFHGRGIRITNPADGATVGPVGDVVGTGWEPGRNNYLIVEPLDHSGQRWVQAQIESKNWTLGVHFGQADTPSGTRFRVDVLSTTSALPIGELTIQPQDPRASPAITITLQK
jgi:hypothetical protein